MFGIYYDILGENGLDNSITCTSNYFSPKERCCWLLLIDALRYNFSGAMLWTAYDSLELDDQSDAVLPHTNIPE